MKRGVVMLLIATLLQSCAALRTTRSEQEDRLSRGTSIMLPSEPSYPYTTFINGMTVTIMEPNGNLAEVINPDGTHSTAMITGSMLTIISE